MATYYVDSASSGGDGTTQATSGANAAFATIAALNAKTFLAGDTILFNRSQTWSGTIFTVVGSGSEGGGYITIDAYGTGANPVISSGGAYGVRFNGKSYWKLQNVDVSAGATGNCIALDGTCDHININHTTLGALAGYYAVTVSGSSTNITLDNIVCASTLGRWCLYWYGASPTNISITNITITGGYGIFINPSTSLTGSLTIANVNVSNSTNFPLSMVLCAVTDGTINDCSFAATNAAGLAMDRCSGITVNRLHIEGAASGTQNGVNIAGACSNITFNDCYVKNMKGDGFAIADTGHDITFNRCLAQGNGLKTTTAGGDGFTTHLTSYNIFLNYCVSVQNICSGFAMVGTSSGHLYNCISYQNAGDWSVEGGGKLDQIRGGFYWALTGLNPTTGLGWTVRNSIGYQNYPREVDVQASQDYLSMDYNCYLPTDASKFASMDGANNISWDTYHTTNGYEPHSISADPKFVSSTDYHLLASSPCINAGVDVGLTTDNAGNAVPVGSAPDVGIYESPFGNLTAAEYQQIAMVL